MKLGKIINILVLSLLAINVRIAGAGEIEDNIKEFCHPIIKEQCSTGVCQGTDKATFNNAIYNSCVLEQTDMAVLKDSSAPIKDLSPKSNTGFLMLFGKFTIWAMDDKNIKNQNDFEKAKKDFTNIKSSYNAFLDKEYALLDTFIPIEATNVKAEKLQQGKIKDKIVLANKRLNFMLKDFSSLGQYKEASQKFLPVIVIKEMSAPFKNQTFSLYECNFLDVNFSKKILTELKQELSFSCSLG